MIIGSGLLAKQFEEYNDNSEIIIFASGVSNSNETCSFNFSRERSLLLNNIKSNQEKHLVYFSSCDVVYAKNLDSQYYNHKLEMEELIKTSGISYSIFRLPQIIGKTTNKHSLINFFVNAIMQEKSIEVWEYAYKNLITIDDIFMIVDFLLKNNLSNDKAVNVVNPHSYSVQQIIVSLENILNKKCNYHMIKKGYKPEYDTEVCCEAIFHIGNMFEEDYLSESLNKYVNKEEYKA